MSARVQRLRVTYSRGAQLQYVSHLDMMRFWERVLRRAQVRVSYSEGFTPHAQIAMAAPLSVGMTGLAELIDIFLAEPLVASDLRSRLEAKIPIGMAIVDVAEVPLLDPSLQSLVRAVVYELTLSDDADANQVEARVADLIAADSFPWEHKREKQTKRYDLRPLVYELRLERRPAANVLMARLRAEESGTGRADQLAAALGISDQIAHIERTGLVLATAALADG